MAGWMDGWMDGWLAGWMDGWMDGWTDQSRRKKQGVTTFLLKFFKNSLA